MLIISDCTLLLKMFMFSKGVFLFLNDWLLYYDVYLSEKFDSITFLTNFFDEFTLAALLSLNCINSLFFVFFS